MSGVVLVLIGLVLGFVGVRSLKLSMALVGFAAGWFLADVFDSSATTDILIGLAGAVSAFLLTLFAARLIFWLLGAVTGVVVGAKLFFVVDQGDSSLVLAFVFIPAVAIAGAFLAEKMRHRFMRWATAAAGAALTLSGLGLVAPSSLGFLRDPQKPSTQTMSFVIWVALGIFMVAVQKRHQSSDE
jgi:hypothetical protein